MRLCRDLKIRVSWRVNTCRKGGKLEVSKEKGIACRPFLGTHFKCKQLNFFRRRALMEWGGGSQCAVAEEYAHRYQPCRLFYAVRHQCQDEHAQ